MSETGHHVLVNAMIASKGLIRIVLCLSLDKRLSIASPISGAIVLQGEGTLREIGRISDLIETLLIIWHHEVVLDVGEG